MVLRILVFVLVVLLVVVGGHVFLWRRLFRDTTDDRRVRLAGALALTLAGASLFLARVLLARVHHPVADALAFAAWCWMGVGMYLGLALAVAHALRAVSDVRRRRAGEPPASPERRRFLARAAVGGAGVVAAGFTGYGVRRAFAPPEIDAFSVRIPRLHRSFDGLRIVQVSDVHVGDVLGRRFLADMVERCNALRPDLVAVTGDLVDGSVAQLGSTVAELRRLRSRFGTYFITGNHEFYSGDVAWCAELERMGLNVLRNRTLALRDGDARLDVVGVDDYGRKDQPRGWDLDAAVAGRDPEVPAVLLAHQPREVERAMDAGIGLQLSGHTHGGQLFPVTGLVGALWRYSAGLYRAGEGHVYVHRGTGFWGPPMRVGSPPQIAAITLTA